MIRRLLSRLFRRRAPVYLVAPPVEHPERLHATQNIDYQRAARPIDWAKLRDERGRIEPPAPRKRRPF